MIQSVSHITFVVKNLEKSALLYKELFGAEEIYDSGEKFHSLTKEKFFIIEGQWIAVMENPDIVQRTYHHIAFKIAEADFLSYEEKIEQLQLELRPNRSRIKGEGKSIYFYDYDNNLFELHTGTLEERLEHY